MQPLMTTSEVAAKLEMTPRQVYSAIGRGDLPAIRILPRTLRYEARDVRAFDRRRRRALAAVARTRTATA